VALRVRSFLDSVTREHAAERVLELPLAMRALQP
jgi:hypothetical protein